MKRREVLEAAPKAPACMSSRTAWVEYLLGCQQTRRGQSRPFHGKTFRVDFNFCLDCTPDFERQMVSCGRCQPDTFRKAAIPIAEVECSSS